MYKKLQEKKQELKDAIVLYSERQKHHMHMSLTEYFYASILRRTEVLKI